MEPTDHSHSDEHCSCAAPNSTQQTLSELDFERGIWQAAQDNDMSKVKKLLSKGTSPNIEDSAGYTALHYAARNGNLNVCEELLTRGANVDATTRSGKATALHRAATQGHFDIVRLLLRNGADANLQDADGSTALHRALTSDKDAVARLLIPKTNLDLVDKLGYDLRQLAKLRSKSNLF